LFNSLISSCSEIKAWWGIVDEELKSYLKMLKAKMSFAERFYDIRMNYLPLFVGNEIIILDKNDCKIKRLSDKKPLNESELEMFLAKI